MGVFTEEIFGPSFRPLEVYNIYILRFRCPCPTLFVHKFAERDLFCLGMMCHTTIRRMLNPIAFGRLLLQLFANYDVQILLQTESLCMLV